jgi:hypothetical protein
MSDTSEDRDRRNAGDPGQSGNGADAGDQTSAGGTSDIVDGSAAARPSTPGVQTVLLAFGNPDEFLAELRDYGPNVDGVLRLTFRWHPYESGAPINELFVVANYLRRITSDVLQIVRLDHDVGEVWSEAPDGGSQRTRERAVQIRDRIRAAAEALGFEVRAGTHVAGGAGHAQLP